jgi:hypothetical protein
MKYTPTFLYIKTHNITGLKYFGKTVKDPFKYKGSGVVWNRHINKHGNDVTTEILNDGLPYSKCEDLTEAALAFSNSRQIVTSKEWANLMIEDGMRGGNSAAGYSEEEYLALCKKNKEIANRPEVKEKIKHFLKLRVRSAESKAKTSTSGKVSQNLPEHRARQSELMKKANEVLVLCPHCEKQFNRQMFSRWHGEKCKNSIFKTVSDANHQ